MKGGVHPEQLQGRTLVDYAELCGSILAKAHARTGYPTVIASYCGTNDGIDRAMVTFARVYADQVERDHAALVAAVDDGGLARGDRRLSRPVRPALEAGNRARGRRRRRWGCGVSDGVGGGVSVGLGGGVSVGLGGGVSDGLGGGVSASVVGAGDGTGSGCTPSSAVSPDSPSDDPTLGAGVGVPSAPPTTGGVRSRRPPAAGRRRSPPRSRADPAGPPSGCGRRRARRDRSPTPPGRSAAPAPRRASRPPRPGAIGAPACARGTRRRTPTPTRRR